jgi:hypothetical protein
MKFNLPRQISNPQIDRVILKEIRTQKIYVIRASKSQMRDIAEISQVIKQQGLPKHLVRKKLPGKLGYGIFLHPQADPILKGQIIAPYSGEVMLVPQNEPDDSIYAFAPLSDIHLSKQDQQLIDPKHRHHPRRLYSLNVDAVKQGNFTRFINHSDTPNLVAELFRIPANSFGLTPSVIEVVYLAKKTIRPGEQLLICYEDEEDSYWGALNIKPVPLKPNTFRLSPSLKVIGSI